MEATQPKTGFLPTIESTPDSTLGIQNQTIIIVLLVLLGLSFLGINLFTIIGTFIENLLSIFGPMFAQIFSIFGYTTGSVINKTADVVGDVAKTGVDVAEGAQRKKVGGVLHVVEDVGRGLIDRRDARARRGVRRLAGMQRQRVETRCSLGHVFVSRFVVGARDYRGNERRTIEGFCGGAGLAESGSHPPCRAPSPILRTGEGTGADEVPSPVAKQWEKVADRPDEGRSPRRTKNARVEARA